MKRVLKDFVSLMSVVSVFAGMLLIIMTAAGIEQDVLDTRSWIVFGIFGVVLMCAGMFVDSSMERMEDDEYEGL